MKGKLLLFILILTSSLFGQSGYLQIETEPSGAQITIDGQNYGNTPSDLITLNVGARNIKISQKSYVSKTITIVIRANEIEKQKIILEKAEPFTVKKGETDIIKQELGKLTVITSPSGAKVFIDDVEVPEKTPFTVEKLGAGTHSIRVEKYMSKPLNDILKVNKEVSIKANQTELLNIDLNGYLHEGQVKINSNKTGNILIINLVNGKEQNLRVPTQCKLLCGQYRVEWTDSFKKRLDFSVDVNKQAVLYLPFEEVMASKKGIDNHEDFISYSSYFQKMYKPKPEYRTENRTKFSWDGRCTGGLALATLTGAIAYAGAANESIGVAIGFGALTGICAWLIVERAFTKVEEQVSIQPNIDQNLLSKQTVQKSYDLLKNKWKKDIEQSNLVIETRNVEIKENNAKLPAPSVEYK